jgi:NAD+ synthase (glutamine-hydrolysing)
MAVFPELCITGYPPEDLLLKSIFIDENIKYTHRLKELAPDIITVTGFVNSEKDGIYNSAAVIYNNRIHAVYNKHFLPNYSVFDEERYFKKGSKNFVLKVAGTFIGINICEDIFHPEGPVRTQALAGGAELSINISASPYHTDKIKERMDILSRAAIENNLNIVYLNMIGGQDELVFDGNSLILNKKGRVLASAKSFAEDVLIYDYKAPGASPSQLINREQLKTDGKFIDGRRSLPVVDLKYFPAKKKGRAARFKNDNSNKNKYKISCREEEILEALILGTGDYVRKNNFKKVVIALSGGIDSALTIVIASLALGKDNVTGVLMPSLYSSPGSIKDSEDLCRNLGVKYITIPISTIYKSYLKSLSSIFKDTGINITKENIQARIRGNIIMAVANENSYLVLSTGNKSEISVGYCTLYGDMAGGFSPIKDVYKTMVYRICSFINKKYSDVIPENILTKVPSAELKPGQKDEDSLPPYKVLDPVLKEYIEENLDFHSIIKKGFDKKIVKNIINMVDSSEYKRRQGSPGIKITPRAFGKDRRYPITNNYRL